MQSLCNTQSEATIEKTGYNIDMLLKILFICVLLTLGHASEKKQGKRGKGDSACTKIGGICQSTTYLCPGRYLQGKCGGASARQCCLQDSGAWDNLCAGHVSYRVRGCNKYGCGGFNAKSRRRDASTIDDGVKLSNSAYCVKIFYIRPYQYSGPISKGDKLGYLLPMQEQYLGVTSHLHLQMCDKSDPTPYI
ncbi:leukocyte cell-derived chemotaxin-2-like isoform X1 [Acipenser oxyrinchus oxyrinchus]|uniref:Leukocyte cell-derived chemotaxin-2-like isoform X1 n=1 Tax=Acipenser oxyrinchus oxyrinchus TaxID=40147 RepID=A0AAD8D2A8_ACIOX|nr:leukocyte cell-derived chemotaxin-2-like isoform X1 [Acipenser oxyrinchus oxyrinchus]